MEGVFGDGREAAVCGSPASRRADGGTLQRVRDLPQDRLQDLISRKTGYKIFDRYKECGVQGLPTGAGAPVTMLINFLFRWKTIS